MTRQQREVNYSGWVSKFEEALVLGIVGDKKPTRQRKNRQTDRPSKWATRRTPPSRQTSAPSKPSSSHFRLSNKPDAVPRGGNYELPAIPRETAKGCRIASAFQHHPTLRQSSELHLPEYGVLCQSQSGPVRILAWFSISPYR
ncbi:hypothetical protein VTJ04DRAFT_6788 [Mycothermus thermophilus]|uniref:uncharacterized protein n=1 Tax=Humicola insolens TaxID=85995 RepID=UPI0037422FAB